MSIIRKVMYIRMKQNIQKFLIALAAFAALSAAPAVVSAASSGIWDTGDCPSAVVVANHTSRENANSNCWGSAVTASAGDEVDVRVIYHNHSSTGAANAWTTVNQPSGSQGSFSFTGFVQSGSSQLSNAVTVTFKDGPHTISLVGADWTPDNGGTWRSLPATGTQNLGTIAPNAVGWVKYRFIVGGPANPGTGMTGGTCTITSFTANPASITAGSSATLSWNTTGCTSVSLAGGRVSGNVSASGSRDTGAVNSTTTYVLTAAGGGASRTASAVVNVRAGGTNPTACVITNFSANPSTVQAGGSSMLSWSTTGCSNVTISGPGMSGQQAISGSAWTGALYGASSYTLTAMNSAGQSVSQSLTVSVNSVVNPSCSVTSFYASPSQVAYGQSTTLYWNTSGFSSVSVIGPGVNSSMMSGSIPTGAIYGTATFTITGYCSGSAATTQTVTVTNTLVNPQGSAPQATTLTAYAGTDGTSETLNGYINSNTSSYYGSQVTYNFQYGTSQYALYNSTPVQTMYSGSGNVSAYVTGLQPNTTYYYQLIASNSYGSTQGGILSFVTNGSGMYGSITAVTSLATNVVPTSARLNGLVYGTQNLYGATTYFEYGTSPSFGSQTAAQSVVNSSANNYFDVISTTPNTTYYYRIVAVWNGQKYYGSSIAFSTPPTTGGPGTTTTVVTRTVNVGVGAGSAFVSLNIADQTVGIAPGDAITYTINWQNVSSVTLTNATLAVILPSGVVYTQSTQGVLTTNNTVVVPVGTLTPGQQGSVTIFARAAETLIPGTNLVTTATLTFTTPGNAQDSAIAYVLNNVVNRNSLAGLALWGSGFFPNTLLGWVLLIGLIVLLVLLARWFYDRQAAERAARIPVQHNYYGNGNGTGYHAPASHNPEPPHAPHYGGYQGDNLPH